MRVWPYLRKGGYYIIRWENPPGVHPRHDSHVPDPPITAKAEAERLCEEFRNKLPQTAPKRKAGPRPFQALTILDITRRWHADNERLSYRHQVLNSNTKLVTANGWVYPGDIPIDWVDGFRKDKGNMRAVSYLGLVLRWGANKRMHDMDHQTLKDLKAPQSKESDADLMTQAQLDDTLARADARGQLPLAHCLSTYAWRPISACRLRVGDIKDDTVTLRVLKGSIKPFVHTLFQETLDLLQPLMKGRAPNEFLFLNFDGEPWMQTTQAQQLIGWYRNHCWAAAPNCGGIYA
jgi:integrase